MDFFIFLVIMVIVFLAFLLWEKITITDQADIANRVAIANQSAIEEQEDIENAINNFEMYTPLAEQGDAQAQNILGVLYQEGIGITRDYQESERWIRLSAEQGYAEAQHNLGLLYYAGLGVPESMIHAYMWISIAKSNGHEAATHNLEEIKRHLNSSSLQRAQAKAVRCKDSNYKKCS